LNKIILSIILLVVFVSVNQLKDTIFVSQSSSQQKIERFFENEDIYNTAHAKYGIYSLGVDQNEKLFVVGMDVSNQQNKVNVEKYMKQQLQAYHLKEYGVEVYVYGNGNK